MYVSPAPVFRSFVRQQEDPSQRTRPHKQMWPDRPTSLPRLEVSLEFLAKFPDKPRLKSPAGRDTQ